MKLAALILFGAAVLAAQEPAQVFGACGGIRGMGTSQPYGCYFQSQHIGTGTYTTEITELVRMKGGSVGTSVRAGIAKRMAEFGPLSLWIVGDAGAAEGATGSASGAFSARPFIHWKIKGPFGLIGAAQLLQVAGTGQQGNVSLGFTFSH